MGYQKESNVLPSFFIICLVLFIISLFMLNGTGIIFSLIGLTIAGIRFYQKKLEFDKWEQSQKHAKEQALKKTHEPVTLKEILAPPEKYEKIIVDKLSKLTAEEFKVELEKAETEYNKKKHGWKEEALFIGEQLIQKDSNRTVKYLFNKLGRSDKKIIVTDDIKKEFQDDYVAAVTKYFPIQAAFYNVDKKPLRFL